MSAKIFELFGYLTDDKTTKAQKTRQSCTCPFMGLECDGGGNRYQSFLHLDPSKDKALVDFFQGKCDNVPAGVCSLEASGKVWIVCPRRLFTLDAGDVETSHEKFSANLLKKYFGFAGGQRVGVWSEVKMQYAEDAQDEEDDAKSFNYTFDYVISPVGSMPLAEAVSRLGQTERSLQKKAQENGFTQASRKGILCLEDYPVGPPQIVEVMTASTSGGNKRTGTTIQNAFRRAILGQDHQAPGINYRQVWARMVSQLIVKSQIGKAWGGSTIWILQDALTDYISQTTDLNLRKLISMALREVNILSLRYSDQADLVGILLLEENNLYAGKIPPVHGDTDFNRLLQAVSIPPIEHLELKLLSKKPRSVITL